MRRTMSDVEYAQEMECDFSIAAENTLLGGDDIEAACKRSYSEMECGRQHLRHGRRCRPLWRRQVRHCCTPWPRHDGAIVFNSIDTMTLAGAVIKAKERFKPDAIFIDSGAMGAGVIDRIRQLGHSCMDVAFGARPLTAINTAIGGPRCTSALPIPSRKEAQAFPMYRRSGKSWRTFITPMLPLAFEAQEQGRHQGSIGTVSRYG